MPAFILVLILHGQATTVATPLPDLKACQEAGEAWVKGSAKLSGPSRGEYVCVPAQVARVPVDTTR